VNSVIAVWSAAAATAGGVLQIGEIVAHSAAGRRLARARQADAAAITARSPLRVAAAGESSRKAMAAAGADGRDSAVAGAAAPVSSAGAAR